MHITFLLPLLTLFAAPSGTHEPAAWHSYQYPSAHRVQQITTVTASSSPTRVVTTSRTRLNRRPMTAAAALPTTPAPTTTAPSAPRAPAASTDAQAIENAVVRLTNEERAKHNLPPLSVDTKLTTIARAHSLDMRTNNFFSHTNLSVCSSSCRATNAGYQWRAIAENIYWMSGYSLSNEAAAQKIVQGWMNSPGHRANILGNYAEVGVGIDISGNKVTATANYGTER